MSTFKCKMCGGTLEIQSGSTVAECEYCGAKQTLPKLDDEKRANLYDRANHFRRSNEFDKASAIYEQILAEDNTDAEAYWSLVLCRYGIEYVEDPLSHRRVPTVHRAQFTSIYDDDNYKSALKNADSYQRIIYEEEAKAINEIQKGILAISQKEEPFDVFICYKETDDSGKRTHDSVMAQDLYYQLKQEGFKVFFARITLEDKLGSAYEPYIFAALNSAKVMVVLGTKPEHFNAVWVKNEWSRFLSLIKHGEKKMLIPAYKDMDPYNLPKEFSHLQAQDMSKLGFMQDLIRGIKKILGYDKKPAAPTVTERVVVQGDGHAQDAAPLLRRAFLFCEDGEFDNADEYAEKVLDINPECAEAYVVKLLIELELKKPSDLAQCKAPISDSPNYQKAIRFATPQYRETIEGYNNAIIKRIDTARKDEVYARGVELMKLHRYDEAVQYFQKIPSYKDSTQKIDDCKRLKETERRDGIYERATQLLNAGQFDEAARLFESISDHKDSKEKIKLCGERKETARKDAIYSQAMNRVRPQNVDDAAMKKSIEELQTISGYRDVDDQIRALNARLEKWYLDKKNAEEAARIRAEEERRTREREAELKRIKAEETKKKVKKAAKIGIPSVAALAVLLVLIFTLVIPLIRYNTADKLFNEGKYDEAMAIYKDIGGFSESEQRITVLNGIEEIDDTEFEKGIETILSAGVPVKITYGMGGGDFSGATYLSAPQEETNNGIVLLSASNTSNVTPLAATTESVPETTEFTYNSSGDFAGLQTPGRNGYRFVKWELEAYNYQVEGTFEIKFNAVWSTKDYTVEYELDGGSVNGKNVVEYDPEDNAFTLINPTRTGYTFAGWIGTDLSEPTISVTVPTGSYGDRTYTAIWTANEYTVTYDPAGGTVSSTTQTVSYDSDVEYLIPERTGYTFLGWYENATKHENGKWTRTSDLSLMAKWEIIGYEIQYELDGGTNHSDNPSNYQVDTDTITLKDPSRTGYTFTGWTYEGQTTPTKDVKIEKGSIDNKSFTANWEAISSTVTFNANNGVCSTTELPATYDQELTLPEVTRSGYKFLGWFNNGTKYESGVWKNYADIELTAEWEIISYSITYELAGGTNAGNNPASYTVEQTISLEEPSRTGYTFTGWTYEGQSTPTKVVTIAKGTTGEKTYTANWEAISSTITLNPNGGSCTPVTIPVTYDQEFTLPECVWSGHTFSGWYLGDTKVTSGTCKFYEDTTLVAEWDIVQYNISYTMNGGTNAGANPDSYNYHDTITLADPTRKGYTFLGWTFAGQTTPTKNVTIALGTTGDKSYTANWQANTYTVTFDANGGTVSPTSNDVTFDTNVTLPTPERTGYRFDGWFVGTKQYTTGTWKTDTNVTLVAKWTANSYTVTYDDVSIETNEITVTFNYNYSGSTATIVTLSNGEKLNYPTNPTRSNYYFKGWYTDSSCTTAYTFTGTITEDMTLYAGWTSSVVNNTAMNSWSYSSGVYTSTNKSNSSSSTYTITATMPITVTFSYKTSSEQNCDILYIKKNETTLQSCSGSTSYASYTVTLNVGDTLTFMYSKDYSMSSGNDCAYIKDLTYTPNVSYTSTATASCSDVAGLVYNSTSTHVITVVFDENVTLLEPTRVGYTFGGWYYNGNKVESGDWKIAANATLTANWIKNQYTVTLNANGGTCSDSSKTVTYDSSYTLPTPTRTGYIFDGWFCGSTQYSGGTWLTPENTTLVAKWSPRTDITYVVNHYKQNANDDGYTLESSLNRTGTADASVTPSVKSFTHFISPSAKTVTVKPDGTLVVDYYYDRVTYDLTYVTNGGETIEKQTYKYDQTLVISTPTRAGYTFGGWFTNKTLTTAYSATATLNADTTIYAYWTEENKPNDFTYSGTSAITVSAYNGTSTTMWIPAYIGGVPVTTIPASAFENKAELTKVIVPETVTSIGAGAFKGCITLKDITLPFIGKTSTATYYEAVFGYIFGYVEYTNDWSTSTSDFVNTSRNVDGTIWQFTYIPNYRYDNTSNPYKHSYYNYYIPTTIEKVTITNQTTIYTAAFNNCDFIESITIPNTVTSIGEYAFQNCSALKYLNSSTDGEFKIPTGITEIKQYVFKNCEEMTKVEIPANVTHVAIYAFNSCAQLTCVEFVNGSKLDAIDDYAFADCVSISELQLPTGMTSIGDNAFNGCISVEKINSNIAGEMILPNIATIGSYAFQNLELITKVIVPNSVTNIGVGAFKGCNAIEDITLPFVGKSATATYYEAVFGYIFGYIEYTNDWSTFTSDFVNTSRNVDGTIWQFTYIPNYRYDNSSNPYKHSYYNYYIPVTIEKVTITNQAVIPTAAFNNCSFIETITIPNTVTSIGGYAFQNCSALKRLNSLTDGEFIIPTGVTEIKPYAFKDCNEITKVIISANVAKIEDYAFNSCAQLTDVEFATGCKLETIGDYAFAECISLPEIHLPSKVTTIGSYAFNGCVSLEEVQIPATLTSIGNYAFSACISIAKFNADLEGKLIIPTNVNAIGSYAFQNLELITEVVVPNSVTSIGVGAFKGCNAIEDITLPFVGKSATATYYEAVFGYVFGYVEYTSGWSTTTSDFVNTSRSVDGTIWQFTYIPNYRYDNTSNPYQHSYYNYYIPATIEKVTITNQAVIPTAAFNNCSFIETITIPNTVISIGEYAFQNCSALKHLNSSTDGEFKIPTGVTEIKPYAFKDCNEITKVIISANVAKIEDYAFNSCAQLTDVEFATGCKLETIGDYAFAECISLPEIHLPSKVTTIGSYAFNGCVSLEEVQIPATLTSIGNYAFNGCISIAKFNSNMEGELILSENVTTIGSYAFQTLEQITKVVVPNSVTSIGVGAFKGCNAIEDITLPFVGMSAGAAGYEAVFGYIFGYVQTPYGGWSYTSSFDFINTNYSVAGTVWQYTCIPPIRYDSSSNPYRQTYFNYYIPTEIKTVTITTQTIIPVAAFNGCNFIETITIPNTVTSIGDYAFQNCGATVNQTYVPSLSYWNGTDISTSFLGSGTELDPYQINSAADLAYLATSVNSGQSYAGKYFVLNVDIDLNGNSWTPIGTKNRAFAGVFDGNGKKIHHLSVTMNTAYNGLFGYVSGTVKHLGIESGTIAPESTSASTYVGGLVGYLTGTVENCYSRATITVSTINTTYAGGLIGHVDTASTVKDSYASGNVTVTTTSGFAYAGGFVGINKGTIEGSLAFGNVTAYGQSDSYSRNGGFAAKNDGTLTECYRSESQILLKYTVTGTAFCDDGTVYSYSDMISYAQSNWSASVWEYDLKYPNHK